MRSGNFVGVLAALGSAVSLGGCSSSNPSLPASCSVSASNNTVTSSTAAPGTPGTGNVMAVTVNGSKCSANPNMQYPNEPCVEITLCDAGTSTCKVISNLLLDTGSYGIRIYKSVLTSAGLDTTNAAIVNGGKTLFECVGFGDGSSEWGPIGNFDVKLTTAAAGSVAAEVATNVPVQMIDATSATPPTYCDANNSTPDTGPSETGFNGIVGVGLFNRDCGSSCVSDTSNGYYYGCTGTSTGSTCTGSVASLSNQVQNPIAALPTDNNGVILQLPSVPDSGAASVSGYMILGIGTQSNNTASSSVSAYPTDGYGTFTTVFNPFSATSLVSFIDSGSSLLFFPWPPPAEPSFSTTLPDCGGGLSGFYCPSGTQTFAAANTGHGGNPTSCVGFGVANATVQLSNGNMVYSNLTGSSGSDTSADFDWGLPFFLGRKVYVGISGRTISGLGTGPLWAY